MLVATSRSDKCKPTSGRPAVTRTENCIAVKSYIRHKQLFSCLDRKSRSNFEHFHISAMSIMIELRPTMSFFCGLAVVTATRPSRRRSFDRFNYSPSKGDWVKHIDSNWAYRHRLPLLAILWN